MRESSSDSPEFDAVVSDIEAVCKRFDGRLDGWETGWIRLRQVRQAPSAEAPASEKEVPAPLPKEGERVVHNFPPGDPNRPYGANGFRFWTQPDHDRPDAPQVLCECGWEPNPHYLEVVGSRTAGRIMMNADEFFSAAWLNSERRQAAPVVRAHGSGDLGSGEEFIVTLREILPQLWQDAEIPGRQQSHWLHLFTWAGYCSDTEERLEGHGDDPQRRVSSPRYARGLAWTLDRRRAEWFARRFALHGEPRVYTVTLDAAEILGYFVGRNEGEVVVDPTRLPNCEDRCCPRVRARGSECPRRDPATPICQR